MPKKKILNIIIEDTCEGCPYLEYSSYYSMAEDSGYNCTHPDICCKRIIDDGMLSRHREKIKEIGKPKQTLFPKPDNLKHPLSIPNWCPLKDFNPKE